MVKQFFRDGVIYTLSNFLTRGITFLLLPLYTHVLASEAYGVLDYLTVFGSLVQVVIALEIVQGLARFVPEVKDDRPTVLKYHSTALSFTLLVHIPLLISIFIFRYPLSSAFFGTEQYAPLLLLAGFVYFKNSLCLLLIMQLRVELKVKPSAILSFINGVSTILFTLLFVALFKFGVAGALWGQIASGILVVLYFFLTKRDYFRFQIDFSKLKHMLLFSLPLVPSSVGVIIAMYIDRFAINKLLSLSDVGVYGLAFRLASAITIVMIGFQNALTPLVYSHHRDADTPRHLADIFRIFSAVAILFGAGISLFAREIVTLIAPEEYYGAAEVIPLLVAAVLLSQMFIFAPGLGIAKKTVLSALLNIASAVVITVLNFVLIPGLGILGSALATVIGNALLFFGYVVLGQRYYRLSFNWLSISAVLSLVILLFFASRFYQGPPLPGYFLKSGFLLLIALAIFLFRLITKKDIAGFFRVLSRQGKKAH